jgi:multicomponent Na+:H+ antiporter subunit G
MEIRIIISGILLFTGCFFVVISALGIVRLPDFYSRIHAGSSADSLGQTLMISGLIVYEGFNLTSVKMLFIIIFIYIVNPTAAHAIAKAAWFSGLKWFWKKEEK